MSQSDETRTKLYVGSDSVTPPTTFAWDYPINATGDVSAMLITHADGTREPLTEGAGNDYTVTIDSTLSSAVFELAVAHPSTKTLVLYRTSALTQLSNYLLHDFVEEDLDKQTQIALTIQEKLDRTLTMPVGENTVYGGRTAFDPELPTVDGATAGDTIALNSSKTGFVFAESTDEVQASAVIADNAVVRGDGGVRGVKDSGVLINDTDDVSGVTSIDIGATIPVTGVLDEDNLVSDSAVKLATQQSIKAYVDANASSDIGGSVGSVDGGIPRADGTGGTTLQASDIIIDDSDNISGIGTLASGTQTVTGDVGASGSVTGSNVTATNSTDISDNTTHSGSDGKDHSDVVTNTTSITNHISNDGSDHSNINQDVKDTASPEFVGITATGDVELRGDLDLTKDGGVITVHADILGTDKDGTIKMEGASLAIEGASSVALGVAGTSLVTVQSGAVTPVVNNTVDLGAVGNKFKDAHIAGDVAVGGDLTQNVTTGHVRLTIDTDSGVGDRAELYMRSGSETAFLDLQENASRFRVATNTAGAILSLRAGTNDENLVLSGEAGAELASFTGDVEVGGDLTVGASGVNKTWSKWINPSDMKPHHSLPPTAGLLNTGHTQLNTWDFAGTGSPDYVGFTVDLGDDYDGSEITMDVYWTAGSGSGAVVWIIQGHMLGDGESLTTSISANTFTADTLLTALDCHIASKAFTPANVGAGKYILQSLLRRNPASGSDTLTSDARLFGVRLSYS